MLVIEGEFKEGFEVYVCFDNEDDVRAFRTFGKYA